MSRQASVSEDHFETPSTFVDTHGVIVVTMNEIPGYRVKKVLGTVYGLTVRARNWGSSVGAVLKSTVGGEVGLFTTLMYRCRNSAEERMVGDCMARGGNAIIAMRFDVAELVNFCQVGAYGTAVIVEPIEPSQQA